MSYHMHHFNVYYYSSLLKPWIIGVCVSDCAPSICAGTAPKSLVFNDLHRIMFVRKKASMVARSMLTGVSACYAKR